MGIIMLNVKKARHILGKKAEKMTDKQIEDILTLLRAMSNRVIDSVVERSEAN